MGRYYYGMIRGKFWFGVQESNDASYFKEGSYDNKAKPRYYGCDCPITDETQLYCAVHFPNYDGHYNIAKLFLEDEFKKITLPFLLKDPNHEICNYQYHFYKNELPFIQSKLKSLEKQLGKQFLENINFKIPNPNDMQGMEYDYNINYVNKYEENKEKLALIARWCLGKQIEYAIIHKGECNFICEIG